MPLAKLGGFRRMWPSGLHVSWSTWIWLRGWIDLKVPPGNRLHALEGDRKGQYSISINDQWRICFRFLDGDAYDVEVCDYH